MDKRRLRITKLAKRSIWTKIHLTSAFHGLGFSGRHLIWVLLGQNTGYATVSIRVHPILVESRLDQLHSAASKNQSRVFDAVARNLVVSEHRSRSLELERVRCRACQLTSILVTLNERYAAAKREHCPCSLVAGMDRAVRLAIADYRQLGPATGDNILRSAADGNPFVGSLGGGGYPGQSILVAGDDIIDDRGELEEFDDVGQRDDRVGLMRQVRDRCCRQAQLVGEVMHRATIYQGS